MSSNESFADTSTHGKLEAPKSLHGVEDAEVIWDVITQRFPNAAPLLCEMETVIERAEDLLQQLKTPCIQENDTSSSFHTPDSRESNATISIGSDIESFAEETNVTERHVEGTSGNVEASQMEHVIHETQVDLGSTKHCSEQSIRYEEEQLGADCRLNSPLTPDEIAEVFKADLQNDARDIQAVTESIANVIDSVDKGLDASSEERLMAMVAEQNSLEGWAKITDDALREWHDDMETMDVSANENGIGTVVNKNIDNCLSMINKIDVDTSDESDDTKILMITPRTRQNSVSRNSTIKRRSPMAILEEYAKRCKVPIKYEYKSKPNLTVINGDLCGFRAMSCAGTPYQAKNELAIKILWMVAEHQMDGTKLSSSICGLLDLTREEMLEVIAFNKGELRKASQKLYKVCLEKGEATPEYTIRNTRTNQGFMYAAQCVALDQIGFGQGLRRDTAKTAAAENLYAKYIHEMEHEI